MRRRCLLVLAMLSCGPPAPDQTIEGRWVRYHHWADEPPCPQAVEHVDRLVELVTTRLGVETRSVEYWKYRADETQNVVAVCKPSAACARNTHAYTTAWSHDHEVVHTALAHLGYPPQLFVEGVAVVYGCFIPYQGVSVDPELDFDELLSNRAFADDFERSQRNYQTAGSFVRFLIDTHGEKRFGTFYQRAAGKDPSGAKTVFAEVFGLTLTESIAAWRAAPPRPTGSFCILEDDPCLGPADLDRNGAGSSTTALSCLTAVRGVDTGGVEPLELTVRSSERPINVVVTSCDPAARLRALPFMAAETARFRPTLASGLTTAGKDLHLKVYGVGARALVLARPAGGVDSFLGSGDPQVSPYGANLFGGDVTLRLVSSSAPQWGNGCQGAATQLGDSTWSYGIVAPLSTVPADGGLLRFGFTTPRQRLSTFVGNARVDFCTPGCGAAADAGCDFSASASELAMTVHPSEAAGTFVVQVAFAPP